MPLPHSPFLPSLLLSSSFLLLPQPYLPIPSLSHASPIPSFPSLLLMPLTHTLLSIPHSIFLSPSYAPTKPSSYTHTLSSCTPFLMNYSRPCYFPLLPALHTTLLPHSCLCHNLLLTSLLPKPPPPTPCLALLPIPHSYPCHIFLLPPFAATALAPPPFLTFLLPLHALPT
ncbi:hypothetical protein Pcinc_037456 [Petrolisthes cinctipes]|uniref:Uncharacterized protein n=1 Tax=Petrolisthes cinctipes TaxID=88211 RepID=A0AAE1BST9_PETCI|nr:hypothetical protein Pcinc_037456 [Petrolisthes cinctipes]